MAVESRWARRFALVFVLLGRCDACEAEDAPFEVVHAFPQEQREPRARLLELGDGSLIGTTSGEGGGSAFKLTPDGNGGYSYVLLHEFDPSTEGGSPNALVMGPGGELFGTNAVSGEHAFGTLFKMTLDGDVTVLRSFQSTDGAYPRAAMIFANDGNLYGTTQYGGDHGEGTVFRLAGNGDFTTLHSFDGDVEGYSLEAPLIQAADGDFYGTTFSHPLGGGAVFRMKADGSVTMLHSFSAALEGSGPAGLVEGENGDLFGATAFGGEFENGTVFRMTKAGSVTWMQSFPADGADGTYPYAGLALAADGYLYGTTGYGGLNGVGVLFRISAGGERTTLHSFDAAAEGGTPWGDLIVGDDGTLFGTTTQNGGGYAFGSVFKASTAGDVTVLHLFAREHDRNPYAGLIRALDGNFYGTTRFGGFFRAGSAYRMTPDGVVTLLHSFDSATEGRSPTNALLQADDGSFYGTTVNGGTGGGGTIYKMSGAGDVTVLHSLTPAVDGSEPRCTLIQATDGNYYGLAYGGGPHGSGTAFRVTTDGAFSVLHAFDAATEGAFPAGGLLQGHDGHLYGTSRHTIFKMTLAGEVTTLHSMSAPDDGGLLVAGLIQTANGDLYGTAANGGPLNYGTVFKVTPAGSFTMLHAFDGSEANGPFAPLIEASDGNFYGTTIGTTFSGGAGTVFRMTPAGDVTVLHNFQFVDGASPSAPLLEANGGWLYGTASSAGPFDAGTVFRIQGGGLFRDGFED